MNGERQAAHGRWQGGVRCEKERWGEGMKKGKGACGMGSGLVGWMSGLVGWGVGLWDGGVGL